MLLHRGHGKILSGFFRVGFSWSCVSASDVDFSGLESSSSWAVCSSVSRIWLLISELFGSGSTDGSGFDLVATEESASVHVPWKLKEKNEYLLFGLHLSKFVTAVESPKYWIWNFSSKVKNLASPDQKGCFYGTWNTKSFHTKYKWKEILNLLKFPYMNWILVKLKVPESKR